MNTAWEAWLILIPIIGLATVYAWVNQKEDNNE
jgi:hypothetical protein